MPEAISNVRAVVLINIKANHNLEQLFRPGGPGFCGAGFVRCYIFNYRRPYHLANVHAGKNAVLFNDQLFDKETAATSAGIMGSISSKDSDSEEERDPGRGEESEGE